MAFLETLKTAAQVVIEAAKNNPLAAGGIVVGTGATIGGSIYLRRRYKAKKALAVAAPVEAAAVEAVTGLVEEVKGAATAAATEAKA
ncbi:hypothetical protein D9M68_20440 [compost metagenome]